MIWRNLSDEKIDQITHVRLVAGREALFKVKPEGVSKKADLKKEAKKKATPEKYFKHCGQVTFTCKYVFENAKNENKSLTNFLRRILDKYNLSPETRVIISLFPRENRI